MYNKLQAITTNVNSIRTIIKIFEENKDNEDFPNIISGLMIMYSNEHPFPGDVIKPVSTLRGERNLKNALAVADIMHIDGSYISNYSFQVLDHSVFGKDRKNIFHVIGRPYGIFLDKPILDKLTTLVENGTNIQIRSDRYYCPGHAIEIDITEKKS